MTPDPTTDPADPIERAKAVAASSLEAWRAREQMRTLEELADTVVEDLAAAGLLAAPPGPDQPCQVCGRLFTSVVHDCCVEVSELRQAAAPAAQPGALRDAIAAVREPQEFEGPDAPHRPDLLEFAHRARRLASFAEFYLPPAAHPDTEELDISALADACDEYYHEYVSDRSEDLLAPRIEAIRAALGSAGPAAQPDDEAVKRLERKLDTIRAIAQGVSSGADDIRKEIDNVTRALAALRGKQQ